MEISITRALLLILVTLAGTSFISAATMVVSRDGDQTEQISLNVPDSWTISTEDPGTDFIVHNTVAKSSSGDQKIRVGWLTNTDVPMKISDPMMETFKSQMQDWLSAHQISGEIKGTQEMNMGGHETHLVQLEITHAGTKSEVDYYVVLGRQAIYVISAYLPQNGQLDDIQGALQSLAFGQGASQTPERRLADANNEAGTISNRTYDESSRPGESYSNSNESRSGGTYYIPVGLIIRIVLIAGGIGVSALFRFMGRNK